MILKNLFTGQQWRNRHRVQTYGHGERGGEGEMHGESNMETCIAAANRQTTGICCMAQETQTGALCHPEGEEDGRWFRREGIYVYL